MKQFNDEKVGLIILFKAKISTLESKYKSKCEELECYKNETKKIQTLKELEIDNLASTKKSILIRTPKDSIETQENINMQEYLSMRKEKMDLMKQECQLQEKAVRLCEQERIIEERNKDTMKQ